ncbi:MAG: trehalose-phosphatase [Archangium sp.]
MRHLLAAAHEGVLQDLAAEPSTLLAFDFDGTLAPIVDQRQRASMRSTTAALLRETSARFKVAVISGRARADVKKRLSGSRVHLVFGGHGLGVARSTRRQLDPLRRVLRAIVATHAPRLELEDKGSALAVHFIGPSSERTFERLVLRAHEVTRVKARTVRGRRVIEFIAPEVGDKGDALREAMRLTRSARAVFVGDDRTDEDAFALAPRVDVLGVRVGRRASSCAPFFLRHQREVDVLLRTLLRLRSRR